MTEDTRREHTPIPFMLAEDANAQGTNIYHVYGAEISPGEREVVATVYKKELAEYIVKACNAYEADQKLMGELEKALKMLLQGIRDERKLVESKGGVSPRLEAWELVARIPLNQLSKAKEVGR